MGKISPVSAKYIIHASIENDGVVERPDVIGAIFGQTEGLLGSDLELRELQRSGRIGRIEVETDTKSGKTKGSIIIPSSLDKAETCIIAAAMEIIQRIGPCNAKIKVEKIEDVRISKRSFIIDRAKELLRNLMDDVNTPDSQEIAEAVSESVRVMEIQEYGKDRLPAGPAINESDEVIVVEGRADVLNLLKNGFKNAIAMNGTSVPQTIIDLCKQKIVTLCVDGDRGGDLMIKDMLMVAEVDFVTKAPDGKEIEELTKKELHKVLRGRVASEQAKLEGVPQSPERPHAPQQQQQQSSGFQRYPPRPQSSAPPMQQSRYPPRPQQPSAPAPAPMRRSTKLSDEERAKFKSMLENLIGTRGAYILDAKLSILGKVPITELLTTIKSLHTGVYAIALDGPVDRDTAQAAERASISYVVGMENKTRPGDARVSILTPDMLE